MAVLAGKKILKVKKYPLNTKLRNDFSVSSWESENLFILHLYSHSRKAWSKCWQYCIAKQLFY